MQEHSAGSYGAAFADVYDRWYGEISDVAATVRGLVPLSQDRPVLELGVGTGRVALPLAASGSTVLGIDASREMLDVLRSKAASPSVATVLGDMAVLPLADSSLGLVFAAFNTFFNLGCLEAQRRCLGEVARVLGPRGRFVVEGFVPPPDPMPRRGAAVRDATDEAVTVVTSRHDPATQVITGEHVEVTPDGVTRRPWLLRYAHPDQLDAMAAAAGLTLESRFASWSGDPFDERSEIHVSTYVLRPHAITRSQESCRCPPSG